MRTLAIGIVALVAALLGVALAADDPLEALLRAAHAGHPEALFATFTDEMKAAVPLPKLREVVAGLGALEAVEGRSDEPLRDLRAVAHLRCRFAAGRFNVTVARRMGEVIAIEGLHYEPAGPAAPAAEVPAKTRFSLPFRGAWLVGNGGRDPAKNNHKGNRQQEFAFDFIRPHRGDGSKLDDYEAFGQEVTAPADGVIAQTIEGSIDLPPGEHDPYVIPGNLVVIDHGGGEWSFLAHFKQGSIRVKPGQKVARGDVLGLCGNTGNTSEPHIHFHVANAALMHRGEALAAPFAAILVDGKRVENAMPERGNKVENAP